MHLDHPSPISHVVSAELIRRFPRGSRQRLTACVALSDRVAQLAHTHPVLLFALADQYGPLPARREVVRRAVAGRPLSDVAAPLSLPLCLRRLPPEACSSHLPFVRWSPQAGRLLAPYVPSQPDAANAWLRLVTFAARTCNETFAIWVAKQRCLYEDPALEPRCLLPLALHSWHAQQTDSEDSLLTAPDWSPTLALPTALERAGAWFRRLRLLTELGPDGITDSWVPAGDACGFAFEPLMTPRDLIAEAHVMQNCIDTYGRPIARNACRLFRVTRKGRSIATLELRHARSGRSLTIDQLKGPANKECPLAVWYAAWIWLEPHQTHASLPPPVVPPPDLSQLLQPYRVDVPDGDDSLTEWLTFAGLKAGLDQLKRRVKADHPAAYGRRA